MTILKGIAATGSDFLCNISGSHVFSDGSRNQESIDNRILRIAGNRIHS